ncbi:hypothetical protein [Poriferisphaera sp. WC338]|uniref:hypothetical protein n=1 Tax=Poriferisphaera sp. WC338 TaxID=3425129 RepID=UPI003D81891F
MKTLFGIVPVLALLIATSSAQAAKVYTIETETYWINSIYALDADAVTTQIDVKVFVSQVGNNINFEVLNNSQYNVGIQQIFIENGSSNLFSSSAANIVSSAGSNFVNTAAPIDTSFESLYPIKDADMADADYLLEAVDTTYDGLVNRQESLTFQLELADGKTILDVLTAMTVDTQIGFNIRHASSWQPKAASLVSRTFHTPTPTAAAAGLLLLGGVVARRRRTA